MFRGLRARLAGAALVVLASPAFAQSPLPTPNITLDGIGGVGAAVAAPDGGYVVGGGFRKVFGTPRSSLAKLTATGALIAGFDPSPNGDVSSLVLVGSSVLVGGSFTQIGGVNRAYLAKMAASDGAIDPAFNAALSAQPFATAVDASGNVYVAVLGASAGGTSGRQVVKLDGATGNAVVAWNPSIPFSFTSVSSMAVDGSWLYLVGPTNAPCAN